VETVNRDDRSRGLLERYRRAQTEVVRLQRRVDALGPTARPDDVTRARIAVAAAKLRVSNIANVYRGTNSDPASGSPLRLIAPAASAKSDFRTVLEQTLLIGLAAGLVFGLGLALARANRGRLRAMRE
jgi:hypothetical protein